VQTIAIVNEKGGTGKTTTAVNLAAALGERGCKVLLVDLDGQAASSRWLGVEDDTRLADALWRGSGLEPIPDVVPGVSLAPGSGKLDSVAHDLRPTQGGQLRKLLSQQTGYDYVLIDCPPSLGNRLIGNALLAAGQALVPVETSILALDGLKILLTTLDDVREGFGHDIRLAGVLACRYDARTRLSRLVLAELRRAIPGKVFHTVIRETVRMRECPASGMSILAFAPDCHAAEDYRALAAEVVEGRVAADAGPAGTLSDAQRLAVAELRDQAAAMVRQQGRKGAKPTPTHEEVAQEVQQAWAFAADTDVPEEPPRGGEEAPAPASDGQDAQPDDSGEAWRQRLEDARQVLERIEKGGAPSGPQEQDEAGDAKRPPGSWEQRLSQAEEALLETPAPPAEDDPRQVIVDLGGLDEPPLEGAADDTAEMAPPVEGDPAEKIVFECEGCGAVLRVGGQKAGRTGRCPQCQTRVRVPEAREQDPILRAIHAKDRPGPDHPAATEAEDAEQAAEGDAVPEAAAPQDEPREDLKQAAADELAEEVRPDWQDPAEADWSDEPAGPPAEADGDSGPDDFPAIREYLKKMQWRGSAEGDSTAGGKRPSWRGIFRRLTSKK